ncbi:MAG: sulfate permease [Candidatus Promineifilaceae bacterium]
MRGFLQRHVPILDWLPRYDRTWLRSDLIAGLAIWAVTVPQGLAYAGIAGVPAVYGLYTVPLAMVGYAIFGTSRTLSVGPDSATVVLSAVTVGALVAQGTDDYIALSATLALLVGVLFVIFGLLRLGWVANFLSNPVMKGFIQGLALIVIVGQLPKLFGIEGGDGNFFEQLWVIITSLPESNLATTVVGFASLALLLALKRYIPKAPSALITVILAILVVTVFNLEESGVDVVGTIETGLPPIGLPGGNFDQLSALIGGAMAIVLVGYTESLGAANAAAATTGEEIDPNQELVALGVSNLGSGLSSGFVVAGSLSRTSVVVDSGGKSQMVSLVNALLVLLTLVFLMPFFQNLPQATLGAIVIQAMMGMLDLGYFRRMYRISKPESVYASATLLGELLVGVLLGVLLGVVISLLLIIRRTSRPNTAAIGKIPGEETFRDVKHHPEAKTYPGLLIFRFDSELYFPNADYFSSEVRRHIAEAAEPVQEVLVNAEEINDIDTTGVDQLIKLNEDLDKLDIRFGMAHVKGAVRDLMNVIGAVEEIGEENIFESVQDGIDDFLERRSGPTTLG